MKAPAQKLVICHTCGYSILSRDTYFKRNLNKQPVYCGKCGSRDFIEIIARGYHLIICRKAEDIEKAVELLGLDINKRLDQCQLYNIKIPSELLKSKRCELKIPKPFLEAFRE